MISSHEIASLEPHQAFIWYPGKKNPVKVSWEPENWKKYKMKNKHFEMRQIEEISNEPDQMDEFEQTNKTDQVDQVEKSDEKN